MPVPSSTKTKSAKPDSDPKTQSNGKKPKKGKEDRAVVYPRYETLICCNPKADLLTGEMVEYDGPISVQKAKDILGWETEEEYVRRRMTEDPNLSERKLRESDFLLKDSKGNKIRCRHNTLNRPFDEKWARKLAQDVLLDGYMMNGEDIIIGCTGLVLSGQHRLVGEAIAGEMWLQQGKNYRGNWVDVEPYIESVIFVGASEDPAVLQTYDNVKPRQLSDTIYTSPIFASYLAARRKRCCVLLGSAIKWLWRRLDATSNRFVEHQTHSAALDFLDRHEKHMVAAVRHIESLDGDGEGYGVSLTYKLNAGRAAGMLFLMGCSGTPDEKIEGYHALTSPKKESQLTWSNWDKALDFWTELVRGIDTGKVDENKDAVYEHPKWVENVKTALLSMGNNDLAGRVKEDEKAAVIALAWYEYLNGTIAKAKVKDIVPETKVDPRSNRRYMVDDGPTFGGPDKGPVLMEEEEDDQNPPDENQDKEAVQAARTERLKAIEAHNAAANTIQANIDKKVVPVPSPKNAGSLNGQKAPAAPPVAKEEEYSLTEGDEQALTDHMNAETIKEGKANRKAAKAAKKK